MVKKLPRQIACNVMRRNSMEKLLLGWVIPYQIILLIILPPPVFVEQFLKSAQGEKAIYDAAKNFIRSMEAVSPYLVTETKGVNIADRLAALLAAHRDPKTFKWVDSSLLSITRRNNSNRCSGMVVAEKETCHVL